MTIETSFLNKSEVKSALKINEIKSVQRTLTNGQKKRFEASLQMSKLVQNAVEWYEGDGKQMLSEEGITWTKEDLFTQVFGYKRSFAYKLLKAAAVESEKVEAFNSLCDEAEREGKSTDRSVEGLLKWVKNGGSAASEGDGGEGEGEGEGEGTEQPSVERAQTILTLAFKRAVLQEGEKNVSVRVGADGVATTTNSREEIEFAINFLRAAINQEC